MKLSQLIEYNKRNIFFKNHAENEAERLDPHLILFCKDTHRKKVPSNKTPALKRKYEHGRLGCWYIKSIIHKRFLN